MGETRIFELSGIANRLEPASATPVPFSIESGNLDEYQFRGQVNRVQSFRLDDMLMYALDITVLRMETDIDLVVYVRAALLPEGYHPVVGDQVAGSLWLQGRLVE